MKIVKIFVSKLFITLMLSVLAISCSFVEEDMSSCPTCPKGFWLQLVYSYNMLDVDAADKQVKQASVFIFNENGQFQDRQDFDSTALKSNGYRVKIEGISAGNHRILVWGGLNDAHYRVSPPVSGDNVLAGYTLNLSADYENVVNSRCMPLFYGLTDKVEYDGDSYVVQSVSLVKDTKRLSCLIVDEHGDVMPNDYSIVVESTNGVLDSNNGIAGNGVVAYLPYYADTVNVTSADKHSFRAAKYELNTLRFMKGDNCRLIIKTNSSQREILDISLCELLMKSAPFYQGWSEQEYLDRQDYYTLIFYLDMHHSVTTISVNGWILRLNDNVELRE